MAPTTPRRRWASSAGARGQRQDLHLRGPTLGQGRLRRRDGRGYLLRRLAHHPHLGSKVIKLDPIHGFAAETAAASVIQLATHSRHPRVDHPHDHRVDHGRRLHAAPLRGALGRGRQHHDRLGPDLAGGRPRRRGGVPPRDLDLLVGSVQATQAGSHHEGERTHEVRLSGRPSADGGRTTCSEGR